MTRFNIFGMNLFSTGALCACSQAGLSEQNYKATTIAKSFWSIQTILMLPDTFLGVQYPNNEYKIINKAIATLNYFRIFNRRGNPEFEVAKPARAGAEVEITGRIIHSTSVHTGAERRRNINNKKLNFD